MGSAAVLGSWDAVDVVPYEPETEWVKNTAISPAVNTVGNPFCAFLVACGIVLSVLDAVL